MSREISSSELSPQGLHAELQQQLRHKPSEYLKELYFGTIVHSVAALQYLIQVVGAERVVIDTDYPMAMGDFEPVGKISQLDLNEAERTLVLGGNAKNALNF